MTQQLGSFLASAAHQGAHLWGTVWTAAKNGSWLWREGGGGPGGNPTTITDHLYSRVHPIYGCIRLLAGLLCPESLEPVSARGTG